MFCNRFCYPCISFTRSKLTWSNLYIVPVLIGSCEWCPCYSCFCSNILLISTSGIDVIPCRISNENGTVLLAPPKKKRKRHDTTRHAKPSQAKPRHDTTRRDATRRDTTRHDATRHDTTRHDTTRHDTKRNETEKRKMLSLGAVLRENQLS